MIYINKNRNIEPQEWDNILNKLGLKKRFALQTQS